MQLPKPWYDLKEYRRIRIEEARSELDIAKKFLKEGLTRNAAGKVFQAWKALVAALATDKRDELSKVFSGKLTVPRPEWRGFCVHWGFSTLLWSSSRAWHHLFSPCRQLRGGWGSWPARLAPTQLQNLEKQKTCKSFAPCFHDGCPCIEH